jgi:hypothetical protein
MSLREATGWRLAAWWIGRRLAVVVAAAAGLLIVLNGAGPRMPASGLAWAQEGDGLEPRDALTEFLCCGQTTGGTWVWVDADRPDWRCDRDGAPTEPYQVPCR